MTGKVDLTAIGERLVSQIREEAIRRSYSASNELRTAAMYVLAGRRSGRWYRVPNTGRIYRASAPGEAPADRLNGLRSSWNPKPSVKTTGNVTVVRPSIVSRTPYNKYLDPHFGDGRAPTKIQPRPYVDPIRERATPAVKQIYKRPYLT